MNSLQGQKKELTIYRKELRDGLIWVTVVDVYYRPPVIRRNFMRLSANSWK